MQKCAQIDRLKINLSTNYSPTNHMGAYKQDLKLNNSQGLIYYKTSQLTYNCVQIIIKRSKLKSIFNNYYQIIIVSLNPKIVWKYFDFGI